MRDMLLVTVILMSATADAAPGEDWAKKYPPAAQALASMGKKMPLGTSMLGGWIDEHADEAKLLADFLKSGAKPAKMVDDPIERWAEEKSVEALTRVFMRQMTFTVYAQAFYAWAKKFPDASYALLTTPGVGRAVMPFYDEMNPPPPADGEPAAPNVFGTLEKMGKDRTERYEDYDEMKALPKSPAPAELQKSLFEIVRDHYTKYPFTTNEDNAKNEVIAVLPTEKGWSAPYSEATDLYEDKLGRKMQRIHHKLGTLVVIRHEKERCLVFEDHFVQAHRQDETAFGPVQYLPNPSDKVGKRIDCAKVKK